MVTDVKLPVNKKPDRRFPLQKLGQPDIKSPKDVITGFEPITTPTDKAPEFIPIPTRQEITAGGIVNIAEFPETMPPYHTVQVGINPGFGINWYFHRDNEHRVWQQHDEYGHKVLSESVASANQGRLDDLPQNIKQLLPGVPKNSVVYAYHYDIPNGNGHTKLTTLQVYDAAPKIEDRKWLSFRWVTNDVV